MRLFVAVNFSDEVRSKLAGLRDELRAKSARGNFSATENLHLTIAFLGECSVKQLAASKSALNSLTFGPLDIYVDRIGRFRRNGGDVWWLGIAENEELSSLQRDLTNRLIDCGFKLERREYRPHITIAREVITDAKPWPVKAFGETVNSVELMKSERIQGKLTYTAIHGKPANDRSA